MPANKTPQRSGLIFLSGWAMNNARWDDCLSRLRPSRPCRRIKLPGLDCLAGHDARAAMAACAGKPARGERLADNDARAAMAAHTGSVSFIGGSHDRPAPAASLHARGRPLARGQTFIVPQAGHALPMSHPRQLAERPLDCLDNADVH